MSFTGSQGKADLCRQCSWSPLFLAPSLHSQFLPQPLSGFGKVGGNKSLERRPESDAHSADPLLRLFLPPLSKIHLSLKQPFSLCVCYTTLLARPFEKPAVPIKRLVGTLSAALTDPLPGERTSPPKAFLPRTPRATSQQRTWEPRGRAIFIFPLKSRLADNRLCRQRGQGSTCACFPSFFLIKY